MANHEASCSESAKLCEQLFDFLKQRIAGVTCERGQNWCAYRGRGKVFAYVWHSSKDAWVNVWFRGSAGVCSSFPRLDIRPRNPTSGTWKKFGGCFKLNNSREITDAAELLSSVSFPLSISPR
jgi:hypothetical protein